MAKPQSFKKGDPRINRKGRPKRTWTWAGLLERAAEEIEPKTGKTYKELVTKRMLLEGASGNTQAARIVFDRMDGQPKQTADITSGGKPLLGGRSQVPIKDGIHNNDSDK